MARTLTAGALAAKEARANRFDLLIESAALNIRYSLTTTTAGGFTWEQRVQLGGIGDIVNQVAPGGGLAASKSFRLLVIDDGTGQSISALQDQGQTLRGADLTVSFLFEGEDYADRIILFAGVIHRYARRGMQGDLVAVDELFPQDRLMPDTYINRQDYALASESAVNRPIPILYGEGQYVGPAPLLITVTTPGAMQCIAAGHRLDTIGANNELGVHNNTVRTLVTVLASTIAATFPTAALWVLNTPISEVFFEIVLNPLLS